MYTHIPYFINASEFYIIYVHPYKTHTKTHQPPTHHKNISLLAILSPLIIFSSKCIYPMHVYIPLTTTVVYICIDVYNNGTRCFSITSFLNKHTKSPLFSSTHTSLSSLHLHIKYRPQHTHTHTHLLYSLNYIPSFICASVVYMCLCVQFSQFVYKVRMDITCPTFWMSDSIHTV